MAKFLIVFDQPSNSNKVVIETNEGVQEDVPDILDAAIIGGHDSRVKVSITATAMIVDTAVKID